MEHVNGALDIISIKVGEDYLPIGCLTDNGFDENTDLLETTVRTNTNGWKSYVATGQDYSINLSGLVSKTSTEVGFVTYYDIQKLKRDRTVIEWKKSGGLDLIEYGSGIITSLSNNSAIDEFISFSATIQGQGEPLENPQIEGALGQVLGIEL
ncbi:hypothetical protein N9928_01155 [bacterium]|nr:hypothetical protein [bacterium]